MILPEQHVIFNSVWIICCSEKPLSPNAADRTEQGLEAEEELGIPLGKKLGVLWAREPCTGLYWQDWSQQVRKGEEGAVLCVVRSVPARGSVGVLGRFSVHVCSQIETAAAAWTSEILQLEWKKDTRAGEMVT